MTRKKDEKTLPKDGGAEQKFGLSLNENPELARLLAELDAVSEEQATNNDLNTAERLLAEIEHAIEMEAAAAGDTAESKEAAVKQAETFSATARATNALLKSWLGGEDEEASTSEAPVTSALPEVPDALSAILESPDEVSALPPITEDAPIQKTTPALPTPETTTKKTIPAEAPLEPEEPESSPLSPEELSYILSTLETPPPAVVSKNLVEIFNELNSQRLVAGRRGNNTIATLSPDEKLRAKYEAGFASIKTIRKSELGKIPGNQLIEILSNPQKKENTVLLEKIVKNYAEASGLDEKAVRQIFQQQENKLRQEAQKKIAGSKSFKKEAGKALAKSALYIGGGIGISIATGGLASFFSPLAIGAIRLADIHLVGKKTRKEEEEKLQEIRQELTENESAQKDYLKGFFADLAIAKQLQLGQNREGSLADCLTVNPDILENVSTVEVAFDTRGLEALEQHYNLLNRTNADWLDKHPWANKAVKGVDKLFLAGGSSAGEKTVTSAALFGIGQALRYGGAGAWGRRVVSGLAGAKLGAVGAEYLSGKKGWGEKINTEKYIIDQEAEANDIFEKFKELESEKTNLDSKKYKRNAVKTAGVIAGALAGIALGEAAGAAAHKIGSWWQNEPAPSTSSTEVASVETGTAPAAIAKLEHTEFIPPKEQLGLATIGKGEGIEHALHRQLEANAKELGYAGDLENKNALHHWAGMRAHQIAIDEHYVDPKTGAEIRVAGGGIGHAQYLLDNKNHVHEFIDSKPVGEHGAMIAKEFEYLENKPGTAAAEVTAPAVTAESPISVTATEKILSNIDAKYPGSAEILQTAAMETTGQTDQEKLAVLTDYFYHHPEFKPSVGLIELVSSHDQSAEKLLEFLDHPEVAGNAKLIGLINTNDIFRNQKNIADWLEVLHGSALGRSQGVGGSLERVFQTNGLNGYYKKEFNMPDFEVSQTHVSAFTGDVTFKTPTPINLGLTKGQAPLIDWLYDPSKNSFRATVNFRGQLLGEVFAAKPGENDPNQILVRTFESLLDKLKDKIAGK
ncbi:MAG: hypothetical protein WC473_03620 [Patescibacteria group bacterium]